MTGTMKNKPAKCCCDSDPCKIDSFTDAVEVTDANTSVIRSAMHKQSPYPTWLQLDMLVEPSGIGRIFLAWDDSTPGDGIYIEFTPDTPSATDGYISVYTKDDTHIAGPLYVRGGVSDEWHTFTICYDPDLIPDQLIITFEPAGSYPTNSFTVIVPDSMTAGRKAGYGTGNATGDVSVRNYTYDRLWYCGTGSGDCHELGDDWDYYNDLPDRTACHTCDPCPDPLAGGTLANWVQTSGTWVSHSATAIKTEDSNAEAIGIGGASWYRAGQLTAVLPGADNAILGISDAVGYNKLYLKVAFSGGPSTSSFGYVTPSVIVYFRCDEDADTFYFVIYGTTVNAPVETLTYEVFSVTNGGSPTSIAGPTSLTLSTYVLPNRFAWTAGSATVHAPMRKLLVGTAIKTEAIDTIVSTLYSDCACAVPMAKEYTATVTGIATDAAVCNDGTARYFDVALLNLGPVTLKNYDHYDIIDNCFYQSITAVLGQCGFSYDQITDPTGFNVKISQVWIWAWQDGEYTEVRGYTFARYRPTTTAGDCREFALAEVEFRLRYFGSLDMRNISGLVIPVYGSSQKREGAACTNPSTWLDTSGATLTLTAVA